MRVKKPKKPEKSGRENEILRVKKTKNWQKKAFTPTFFFTPKKKTLVQSTQKQIRLSRQPARQDKWKGVLRESENVHQ